METAAHLNLKRAAMQHLRTVGCMAVATEVRCPISRYRADVAGYRDHVRPAGRAAASSRGRIEQRPATARPETVIIECKQSRGDFLRDRAALDELLRARAELEGIRAAMERDLLMHAEPELRRSGTSLFPELDEWRFDDSRSRGYKRLLARLRRLDRRIHGETKFCMLARYRLADRLYIAAPRDMLKPRELPPGWGLLECRLAALRDDDRSITPGDVTTRVAAPRQDTREVHRQRLLRNIAVSASFAAFGAA